MPWDMKDYPNSLKNFSPLLRKKTIQIANALLDEGYPDDKAIPIAISQAKKWYEEASDKEKKGYEKTANPKKTDKHDGKHINQDLLDNDVLVFFRNEKWNVKTKNASRVSVTFKTKLEAVKRAREMAENKGSKVIIYKKSEQISD